LSALLERSSGHPRPVVVQFHAKWCGPCKALSPHVAKMEDEFRDQVDVWRVDVDEDPSAARDMGVRGVPTLVVLREGREVARRSGFLAGEALRKLFQAGLSDDPAPAPAGENPIWESVLRVGAGLGLHWISGLSESAHPLSWIGLGLIVWGMQGFCPSCRVPQSR